MNWKYLKDKKKFVCELNGKVVGAVCERYLFESGKPFTGYVAPKQKMDEDGLPMFTENGQPVMDGSSVEMPALTHDMANEMIKAAEPKEEKKEKEENEG